MTGRGSTYPRYCLSDFTPGLRREEKFLITRDALNRFGAESGDLHPLHCDTQFAQERGYPEVLVHGMLVMARCSAFIARDFVGIDGLLVSMASDFRCPVFCEDQLTWRGEVTRVTDTAATVEIDWQVTNGAGVLVQRGRACSWLPLA